MSIAYRKYLSELLQTDRVSPDLLQNQRVLSPEKSAILRQSLIDNFFSDPYYYPDPPEIFLKTAIGQEDLEGCLINKTVRVRSAVTPWVNSILPLRGAKILEIGTGTGSSALPMMEQGAKLVGIDVSASALTVARDRCRLYELEGEFLKANAVDLKKVADGREFDAIIFYAVIEHMTLDERLTALRAAWDLLKPGQFLIVVEAPNRLWHTDGHTSYEPFFSWLSDDVAFRYSQYTRREIFNRAFHEHSEEADILFCRWGRGVSYHDFVLALGIPAEELPVVSSLTLYLLKRRHLTLLYRLSPGGRYGAFLRRLAPGVHPGFLSSFSLDLAFRKS